MKVRFVNIYKDMKNTTSIWYALKPSISRFWNGEIIHIGTNCFYVSLDTRGIESIEDFSDALKHPKVWRIIKKFKR